MIHIGLVDDQQLVRAGFAMVLESQHDIEVVWQANDGIEAYDCARATPVDVILMDVQMPRCNGITATRNIVGENIYGPAGEPTRVIVLTTFDDDEYVKGAIDAGASGFLLKDVEPEYLIHAVHTVGDSSAVISPEITARIVKRLRLEWNSSVPSIASTAAHNSGGEHSTYSATPHLNIDLVDPLTPRELEILRLIAQGLNNQEIADMLFISLPTVKTHVGKVLAKTSSRDRVQAVLFAFKNGIVQPSEVLSPDSSHTGV